MYYFIMIKKILYAAAAALLSFSLFFSCRSAKAAEKTPVSLEAEPAYEEKKIEDEYSRSTQEVKVSVEEFNRDKRQILKIIDELSKVIDEKDYSRWTDFIEPESVVYWSNPNNLLRASKRLPIRGMRLQTLYDYFTYVFVPSRKGRKVDEIRYISVDSVKAVQVQDEIDVVYYNFVKIKGNWMVKLPPLAEQE